MHALITCLVRDHDLRLVALAAVVCALGCYATFALGTYAYLTRNRRRKLLWGAGGVLASASSVWATHFIAMLAFRPGLPTGFDLGLTAASLLVAVAVIGSGILIVTFARTARQRTAGGVVVALGISSMHYLGMAAYRVPGHLSWSLPTVAVSVFCSMAFCAIAAHVAFHERAWIRRWAPVSLLLGICALHFTGMSAATAVFDPLVILPPAAAPPALMAIGVAAAALLVLALAAAGLAIERRSLKRHAEERARLHTLADVAVEGLLICKGEHIVSCNAAAKTLAGADLAGAELSGWTGLRLEDVPEGREVDAQLRVSSNTAIPVRLIRRPMMLDNAPHMVVAIRDQRERLKAEADLRELALHDALTGLPNRAAFNAALAGYTASRRESDRGFAVMFLDLDRFKAVNDTLGHGVGDLLLQRAAKRIAGALRPGDVAARLGGDEFAVLQKTVNAPDAVHALAGRIVDLLSRPFILDGQIINVGASIGVALAPDDGDTPELLMRNADLALYKAKEEGRGLYRLYEPELDARMQARRTLELKLRRATARQEFTLHYQPLADARTGEITGAEALIRWNDPERGLISPADFIPLAEETGLIASIGHWVLRTACAEAVHWPPHMSLAVNLSPMQFREPRLVDSVKGVLSASGLSASRLELEITESVLLNDEAHTLEVLRELRALGVRISMDDFGTGYSSLSYLRKFPFDKIKVDQSFVRTAPDDAESAAIVRAVITLGACLGMKTTVEGVETQAQFDLTSGQGCDQIQGFFISKPLASDDFRALMRRRFQEAA